ncbi:hypothetical protein AOL_s00169g268 [Orbilia oligospora ATCC 24927]|uniref:Uncharacterized protein n=1 Tax=Arthrobotrys oligospora (strain ATCC 24927 / CBS 115.81 / DSM 1491) TaxID=756982 RepID=G1XN65_ARTOA|nr:hypothetical protein AOL_s00169g268 [Orbilia oligospora ATCC 24927]EGX45662.1 hypothetical protein AOL_s00169g268 [Orbilia oligospora ATCC 24927]
MAWDVVGDLDINVYSYRPRASHDRGLAKRLDFKPVFPRDIYFNDRQIEEIPLICSNVHFPAKDLKSVTDIQAKVEIEGSKEWKKELTSILLSPFAIPGILNFGPELESTLNTEFNFGFANVLAFDPSTIKGPEVNVSAKILGSSLNSGIELLVPKFQYEIEAGYSKEQFCDGFEGMTKDNKAALNNNLANQAPNKTVEIDNIKELGVR